MWERFETFLLGIKFTPLHIQIPSVPTSREMRRLRKVIYRVRMGKRRIDKKVNVLLITFLWPIIAPVQAIASVRRYRNSAGAPPDVSSATLFFKATLYSILHFQPAQEFFKYRLIQKENRAVADWYIHHHEIIQLLPPLSRAEDKKPLSNKILFYEHCTRMNLATAPILGYTTRDEIRWTESVTAESIETDLIVKPNGAECGIGISRFRYLGEGVFEGPGGEKFDRARLEEQLQLLAELPGDYLIQPTVRNHPLMARFSQGGLCTIRVVTFSVEGEQHPVIAALRMPKGESATDNFTGGGYASPVDIETGVLGQATTKNLSYVGDVHPDTGERVTGETIPFWTEVLDLCRDAQSKFASCPTVGWDVAIAESGPILIEGNENWGSELVQIAHNAPLGLTAFPELYLKCVAERKAKEG